MPPPSFLPRFFDPSVSVPEWIARIFVERPDSVQCSDEFRKMKINGSVLPELFSFWNDVETREQNIKFAMEWLCSCVMEKKTGPREFYMAKPVSSCAYEDGQLQINFHPNIKSLVKGDAAGGK